MPRLIAAAVALGLAWAGLASAPASAETKRPPAAALIAAAKATQLKNFEVSEELRGLTVEAWLKKMFGTRPIVWRATTCQTAAERGTESGSPICVLAAVRFDAGVTFTLGVGFDDTLARPQDKPNTIWGTIAVRGKQCDFLRHPDAVQQARPQIDVIVKSGGRCR